MGSFPYSAMRNLDTQQVERARREAALRAGFPFTWMALGAWGLEMALIVGVLISLYATGANHIRQVGLASSLLLAVGGACYAVAGVRTALYLRRSRRSN